jgi:ABC-type uncharacterized transport system permease subunit
MVDRKSLATISLLVAGAVGLFSLLLVFAGKNPLDTFASLFSSTLGNTYGLGEVFVKLIPLLFTALAVSIPAS